jgi:hypothetical protein
MNVYPNLINRVLRGLFKLAMVIAGAIFFVSLLIFIFGAVLITIVWSLLMGRRPAVFTTVSRFRQASQNLRKGVWPSNGAPSTAANSDVVDVQAHEVREISGRALPRED